MHKIILLLFMAMSVTINAQTQKPRILVSTDIGGTDPDDNQSMLHLLMYSDRFDIEGLVSSPSFGNGSKKEILKMIDIYELDFKRLQAHCKDLTPPDELRNICKQGRKGLAPYSGYDKPTEGSEWIINCARKQDDRPLWILVWGTLEDLAQALHDAPDIKTKIKVYYIGGPNKKWGVNSYAYIAEKFPDLWFIENNASYRGFIADSKDGSHYHKGFYEDCLKGAGNMGENFIYYYDGVVKMGDTPSLLYLMNGDADNPEGESWGGSFEKMSRSPRKVIKVKDGDISTVHVYSVVELWLKGYHQDTPPNTPCFNMQIDRQNWVGYYMGKGNYMVRYSPKQEGILKYTLTSINGFFPTTKGTLVVDNDWPGEGSSKDFRLGNNWYTDKSDKSLFKGKWQGFKTVERFRNDVLDDWSKRLEWLKE